MLKPWHIQALKQHIKAGQKAAARPETKRNWSVYGIDKYGRRFNAAGGSFTEAGAIAWAERFAKGDAWTCGFVKVLVSYHPEIHELPVVRPAWAV